MININSYLLDYLGETNNAKVQSYIPTFVELGIAAINKELRSAFLEKSVAGTATLPDDFVAMRFVSVNNIRYSYSAGNEDNTFCIVSNELSISPELSSTDVVDFTYYGINQSVLETYSPQLLLHAAAMEAYLYIGDNESAELEKAIFNAQMDSCKGWDSHGSISLGGGNSGGVPTQTEGTGDGGLAAHINSHSAHGTTGEIVGTTDSQTLLNKTIDESIIGGTTPAAGTFTTLTSTGSATLGDAEATDTHAVNGATTVLANSASSALRITQTGSGNALVVEDSANPDSSPFVIDAEGKVGIGSTPQPSTKVVASGTLPSASSISRAFSTASATAPTTSTAELTSFFSNPFTADGITGLTALNHFYAVQGTITGGTRVGPTNQYGFNVGSTLIGATNNYGFYSNIAAATGRWNFYAAGTAPNYFAGQTGIGAQVIDTERLRVVGASGALSTPLTAAEIYSTSAAVFEAANNTVVHIASSPSETGALFFSRAGATNAGIVQYDHSVDELRLYAGSDLALKCHNTGGVSITKTGVTAPAATDGNVYSGTYTPTLTNVTNVAASTPYSCQYMRVGNVVTVSGKVAIDPTAAVATELQVSLPIPSATTSEQHIAGTFCGANSNGGAILGETTLDVARFLFVATDIASRVYAFNFTYRVI